jgi:predicted regulator of Ras-like GTPase activity (Roadblock/LC7/MglB family)
METILQGLLDLAGVSAAMVFDEAGVLLAHRGRAVYDRPLCEQVSATLVKAIDTVALQQPDWDSITAHYADGKLLVWSIGAGGERRHLLGVVADATLNASFATVAIRVAVQKLRKAIEHPGLSSSSTSLSTAGGAASSDSRPVLESSVSWSKTASSPGQSQLQAADPAAAAFLSRCAKELARHVGPISKIYVQEAIRRVSPGSPFPLSLAAPLLDDLGGQIEDAGDRARFRKALESS